MADVHSLLLSSHSLSHTLQCHAQAAVRGLLRHHLPTCAALLFSYSDHRRPSSSLLLFRQSPLLHSRPFLWNALVRALARSSLHAHAFAAYNAMARLGLRPDARTFPFALKACADAACAPKGRELHASLLRSGLAADVFVGNTLLAFYGSCGFVPDARRVFDEMPLRDVVTWNTMISLLFDNHLHAESLHCFSALRRTSLLPNSVSVVGVLACCVARSDWLTGRTFHGFAVSAGLDSLISVGNAFIDLYAKCGDTEASQRFFHQMEEKSDVSWNSVMGGLVHNGMFLESLAVFRDMINDGIETTSTTLSVLLPALVELGLHGLGREVHAYGVRTGMVTDVFVANSLLDMYAKSGCTKEAAGVFRGIERKNSISWNVMIANFTQNGAELEAVSLLREMQTHGELPNGVTFVNVLPACCRISALRSGREIHAKAIRLGLYFDLFVSNALLDMYVKCGCLTLGRNVFEMSERDEVSYNSLIIGYSQACDCLKALDLFLEMGHAGLKYDSISFMGALSACSAMLAIKQGREIHAHLIRKQLNDNLFVANSLLDLYMRSGCIRAGRRVFDKMPNKDVASWNGMVSGLAMQGELESAFKFFDSMEGAGVEYDSVSYLTVLSACSHSGLVERGKQYFQEMLSREIQPSQMHYACMVDLLGRAAHIKEAVQFIDGMPFEPDSNVWGALLSACKMHGDLEVGRLAAEHLFVLKPEHSGYYILLSNMYAEAGRWSEANDIRKRMKMKGVKKNPGCSWVEGGDKVHALVLEESISNIVVEAT